jgi:hypothetical protein
MNRTDFSATQSRRFVIAALLCLLGFGLPAASPADRQRLASANIEDQQTRMILFMGVVFEPGASA